MSKPFIEHPELDVDELFDVETTDDVESLQDLEQVIISLEDEKEKLENELQELQDDLTQARVEIHALNRRASNRDRRDVALGRAIGDWLNEHTDQTPEHEVVDALLRILTKTSEVPW